MREVVQKVYKFNELEKKVQEEVLKRKRDTWVDGMNWWAYTLEDFESTMYADHLFQVMKTMCLLTYIRRTQVQDLQGNLRQHKQQ